MAVTSTDNRTAQVGNGTNKIFPYNFLVLNENDITVTVTALDGSNPVVKTLTTDYTVSSVGSPSGGDVTFVTAPTASERVVIERLLPYTQLVDYVDNDPFPANTHESALDRLVMIAQQVKDLMDRSVTVPATSIATVNQIDPGLTANRGNVIRAKTDGTGFEFVAASAAAFVNPLTTKGDLVTHNGSGDERLAGPAKGGMLIGDPAQTVGLAWKAVPANGNIRVADSTQADGWRDDTITVTGPGRLANDVDLTLLETAGGNYNVGLAASVAAKALTIALKGKDGSDPSATNPVHIAFRNSSETDGGWTVRTVTSALSLTISNGSTLGFPASQTRRIWIGALDNAGTVELWVFNSVNFFSDAFIRPADQLLGSTTAEGGAGGADSYGTYYSTTARSNVPFRILGWVEIQTGAVAGEWDNAPTAIHVQRPGDPNVGDIVQIHVNMDSAVTTGTTTIPWDNTTPQDTEGDQYYSVSFTPQKTYHFVHVVGQIMYASTNASQRVVMGIFRSGSAPAKLCAVNDVIAANIGHQMSIEGLFGIGTSTSVTLRAGQTVSGTLTINGEAGSQFLGAAVKSGLIVKELFT